MWAAAIGAAASLIAKSKGSGSAAMGAPTRFGNVQFGEFNPPSQTVETGVIMGGIVGGLALLWLLKSKT